VLPPGNDRQSGRRQVRPPGQNGTQALGVIGGANDPDRFFAGMDSGTFRLGALRNLGGPSAPTAAAVSRSRQLPWACRLAEAGPEVPVDSCGGRAHGHGRRPRAREVQRIARLSAATGRPAACSRAAWRSASLAVCSSAAAASMKTDACEVRRPSRIRSRSRGRRPSGLVSSSASERRALSAAVSAHSLRECSRKARARPRSSPDAARMARAWARRLSAELWTSGSMVTIRTSGPASFRTDPDAWPRFAAGRTSAGSVERTPLI